MNNPQDVLHAENASSAAFDAIPPIRAGPPSATGDGAHPGGEKASIPRKIKVSSVCRFLVAFYFAWMGVATLNHIDQRKELLAYVDAKYSEGILKAKALIDLLLSANATAEPKVGPQSPSANVVSAASVPPVTIGFPHIQTQLLKHKSELDVLEAAQKQINALIMTGARTTDRTLVEIEQRVFFGENKSSDGEGMNIIENFLLLKPVIWKTSTGLLIGMLSIMAAVVGAMVYMTKDSGDLDFFARLAAGVGAGIICYFVVKSGAQIFGSHDGFPSYSPYVSALMSFIAGLYFVRFYELLLHWAQNRFNGKG